MNSGVPAVDPKLARSLIRSLTRGTGLPDGARLIHVGHEKWLAAQSELLDEIAEDEYSDTKFVRGAYGAGKSHFLSVIQEVARSKNWATSHVECRFDRVEIDRFETLYPALVKKLRIPGAAEIDADRDANALHAILARWSDMQFRAVGINLDGRLRPFDADIRIFGYLSRILFRGAVTTDLARALMAYALGALAGDIEIESSIRSWLGGSSETVLIPSEYLRRDAKTIGNSVAARTKAVHLKPIKAGTVHDAMGGLLWLIRSAGFAGLVLCIDEVEALARLGTRKRQDRALQALREYVDQAGGDESQKHLCMYLAATPDMFDNEQFFPRYDALASRIQPVAEGINWRAPVIDLDRTPLGPFELQKMARNIESLYRVAYGMSYPAAADFLARIVPAIAESKLRIARPRLLSRIVVDQLDKARSEGANYSPPSDCQDVIVRTATMIQRDQQA